MSAGSRSPARYSFRSLPFQLIYLSTRLPTYSSHAPMLDPSKIRAICFDVDGTLADTDDHVVAKLAALIDRVPGVSGRRAELVARQVVMGAETPTNFLYGLLDRVGLDDDVQRLRDRLAEIRRLRRPADTRNPAAADEVPHEMMAGVREMLGALAPHFPMCCISTGRVGRIERFLAHYEVDAHFTAVVGAETTPRMKPYADPLLYAAEKMGVPPEACVMIGDTTVDVRTGRAAGAQTVGVLCGFGTERELVAAGAGHIVTTTSDVLALLRPEADPLQRSAAPSDGAPPAA